MDLDMGMLTVTNENDVLGTKIYKKGTQGLYVLFLC